MHPLRPLAFASLAVGSLTLLGCAEEARLPRGETMAVQNARYQVHAPPGSTGTIETPGVQAVNRNPNTDWTNPLNIPDASHPPGSTAGVLFIGHD